MTTVLNEVIAAETTETDNPKSLVESDEPTTESPEQTESQANGKTQKKRRKRRNQTTASQVVSWFSVCARCGYFLAGYRLEHDADELEEALEDSNGGWLTLNWNQSMCKLIRKSYGSRVEIDCYHFDGTCPECRRQYSFRAPEDDQGRPQFRIELKPRIGR